MLSLISAKSATLVGVFISVTTVPAAAYAAVAAVVGVVVSLAIQILLAMLGTGIGLATVDPAQPGDNPAATTMGIGAAAWWGLSGIIAAAIGNGAGPARQEPTGILDRLASEMRTNDKPKALSDPARVASASTSSNGSGTAE